MYLAVALTKIEIDVKGNTAPDEQKATSLVPISNISISEIFEKINPVDINFLKYVPNHILDDEQMKEMVKEFVVTELVGKHFVAYHNNNVAIVIGIASSNVCVKNAKGRNKKVVEELYRKNIDVSIKQAAVVLADELIESAKYDKSKSPKHQHDWFDNYGKMIGIIGKYI